MTDAEYGAETAKQLVNGKIIGVFTDDEKEYWGIEIKKDGKYIRAWVDCDTEGNGPGHINIKE